MKSGTSTIEASLRGTPFVTAYRTHPLTFFLARRLVRVDRVALANLVVGKEVVPEVLQDEMTPERLAELLSPPSRPRVVGSGDDGGGVRGGADSPWTAGASLRVAQLAGDLLEGS